MKRLVAALVIVGFPMVLSLSWFIFWVLRLRKAARDAKARNAAGEPQP
jgi:hypothetical protein